MFTKIKATFTTFKITYDTTREEYIEKTRKQTRQKFEKEKEVKTAVSFTVMLVFILPLMILLLKPFNYFTKHIGVVSTIIVALALFFYLWQFKI